MKSPPTPFPLPHPPRRRSPALRLALLLALSAVAAALAWRWRTADPALSPSLHLRSGKATVVNYDPPPTLPDQRTPDHLRVLFIGNSFTAYNGGVPWIAGELAQSPDNAGRPPQFESVTRFGFTLQSLWQNSIVLERIREGHWDYVVLQDHSTAAITNRAELFDYARRFDAEIRKAGAKTLLFLTWARDDEPQNQSTITKAYTALGRELHAGVVPVGVAWEAALRQQPALILHDRYDHKHPTMAGSYLTACVFYATLYPNAFHTPDPPYSKRLFLKVGTTPSGDHVDEGTGDDAFLQRIATDTVAQWAARRPTITTTAPATE